MASRDSAFLWETEVLRSTRRAQSSLDPADDRVEDGKEADSTREESEIDLRAEEEKTDVIPEGTMLVPLDAWNKMVNQLGNLHEAGQQLAEARERAAKAETEAFFLRERLRELREQLEPDEPSDSAASGPTEVESPTVLGSTRDLLRKIYTDWRNRRRGS